MWNTKIWPFYLADAYSIADVNSECFCAVSVLENEAENYWYIEVLSENAIDLADVNLCNLVDASTLHIKKEQLPETNWLQKCFENFKPFVVGKFYILGSHNQFTGKYRDKICLEIDAATAFGSGEHATTAGCLTACQTFFNPKKHLSVLDLGCGSGILAMAIAKLGGDNIFAYDNDPEAVRVTKKNVQKNMCFRKIKAFCNAGTEFTKRRYDLIVSNILAKPLISMSDAIISSLNQNGILILSGFTPDQPVQAHYEQYGLKAIKNYVINGWSTVVFKKNAI